MARIFVASDDGQHIVEVTDASEGLDEAQWIVVCQTHGDLQYGDRSDPIGDAIDFAKVHANREAS